MPLTSYIADLASFGGAWDGQLDFKGVHATLTPPLDLPLLSETDLFVAPLIILSDAGLEVSIQQSALSLRRVVNHPRLILPAVTPLHLIQPAHFLET